MRNSMIHVFLLSVSLCSWVASGDAGGPGLFLSAWDAVQDKTFSVSKFEWWYTIGFLKGVNQFKQKRRLAFMINVVRGADLCYSPSFFTFPETSIQVSLLDLDQRSHFTSQEKALGPDTKTFLNRKTLVSKLAKRARC